MKRPSSLDLDSLAEDGKGRPFAICPSGKEERDGAGTFQSILDGAGDEEEEILVDGDDPCSPAAGDGRSGSLALGEKKRRLSAEQVKALERNFEVENKLEPERKVKLAQELGLQPRQVAIWFQNRRARWKTKQLERDYGLLKAEYDALKVSYDGLHHDKDALLAEIKELKAKLAMGGEENCCSVKEEAVAREGLIEQMRGTSNSPTQQNFVKDDDEEDLPALIYKDGLSDSDSSAILNEESSSPSSGIPSLPPQLQEQQQQQLPEFAVFSCDSPASSSPFHFANEEGIRASCYYYERRSVEDEEFLAGEELCGGSGFLADEQPLSPYWCYSDQWN